MSYKLGQVLHVKEVEFDLTVKIWKEKIIPSIEKAADEYEKLEIGKFSQKTYNTIIDGRIQEIKKEFTDKLKKEIEKSGLRTLLNSITNHNNIEDLTKGFAEAAQNMVESFSNSTKNIMITLFIDKDDCDIIDGKPVLNKSKIEEKYQIRIDNAKQLEILQLADAFKAAHDKLRIFLDENVDKDKPYPSNTIIYGKYEEQSSAITYCVNNGLLEINKESIEYIQ